jgi:golgi-specific brefeldin A-resistance guanine nucleotide exchange factor 1
MEFINGVTCIKGEIHNIMTLFRLSTRWAAHNRFSGELFIQDESPLIRSFRHLNEQLEGIYDLKMVDCVLYLQPFRYVIISDHASGPLTSAALSSISKFVLYGFLSPDFPRASEGINLIANCIPKCIFVETDWESDEVILMKLLELSGLCLQSSSAGLLTVAAAWEIYSTCMSIHSQQKYTPLSLPCLISP